MNSASNSSATDATEEALYSFLSEYYSPMRQTRPLPASFGRSDSVLVKLPSGRRFLCDEHADMRTGLMLQRLMEVNDGSAFGSDPETAKNGRTKNRTNHKRRAMGGGNPWSKPSGFVDIVSHIRPWTHTWLTLEHIGPLNQKEQCVVEIHGTARMVTLPNSEIASRHRSDSDDTYVEGKYRVLTGTLPSPESECYCIQAQGIPKVMKNDDEAATWITSGSGAQSRDDTIRFSGFRNGNGYPEGILKALFGARTAGMLKGARVN